MCTPPISVPIAVIPRVPLTFRVPLGRLRFPLSPRSIKMSMIPAQSTFNDGVYNRLKASTAAKRSYHYQHVADTHVSIVMALNLLVEYLPISALRILVVYLPDVPDHFDLSLYIQVSYPLSLSLSLSAFCGHFC